jgi:PHD/YefM family antitoxin component YafN of YafNO toxin-antitoxin module
LSAFTVQRRRTACNAVTDEAQHEPITLTKHGRAPVVVLSTKTFERLISNDDPRRVYGPGETSHDLAEMLLNELDRRSAEGKHEQLVNNGSIIGCFFSRST